MPHKESRKVTAKVTFSYDFTELITNMEDEFGEMSEEAIKEAIVDDLREFDFRETVGDIEDLVEVKVEGADNVS